MRAAVRALVVSLGLAVLACGPALENEDGANPESQTLHRGNRAEPGSLDPHKIGGQWSSQIMADLFEGLYTFDTLGEPILGAAESVEISDDGLVWTFRLREGLTWSDGTPLTSEDFVYGLSRSLDPVTLNQYAGVLYPIRGGQAVNRGEADVETLGLSAPDPRTVVIELEYPAPYMTEILAQAWAAPVPRHVIEAHGDRWTAAGNMVTNGPYTLAEWRTNDYVRVVANPSWPGAEGLCFTEILYYPTVDAAAATRRIRAGELDLNTDFLPQQRAQLERELPGWVRSSPSLVTFWLLPNTRQAPFDDVRVRRALALAVDVDFIAAGPMADLAEPARRITPPGLGGTTEDVYTNFSGIPLEIRRDEAQALLSEAGFGPGNPLRFTLSYPNSAVMARTMPAIQADLQAIADWVDVSLSSVDSQAHYSELGAGAFEVAISGWAADYNDSKNFMQLFSAEVGSMNHSGWNNADFDALLDAAAEEVDADARAALLAEAEQLVLDEAVLAPIMHRLNRALVDPSLTGYDNNATAMHPSRYLCRAGAAGADDDVVLE